MKREREREREREVDTLWWWWWWYEQEEGVITTVCVALESQSHSSWDHEPFLRPLISLSLGCLASEQHSHGATHYAANQWERIESLHHKWKPCVTSHNLTLPHFLGFRMKNNPKKKELVFRFWNISEDTIRNNSRWAYLSFFLVEPRRESLPAAESSTRNRLH